jgi:polysaccharide deacetylase 2 family uncharacterized protein YibQ
MYTDIPFTGAVLPGMPYTDEESRLLDSNGKDVILQMPASDSKGEKGQDELYISADTEAEKAEDITSAAVNDVNNCIGINTRMGPEIMGNSELVTAIAQVAKDEGLFMLSTLGTDKTKAKEVCEELDVKYFNGDIILDGSGDISAIEKNLKKAAETAIENGYIIAVGHVGTKGGKATAQAVKNVYENFKDRGIHFVTMSELIKLMDENTY